MKSALALLFLTCASLFAIVNESQVCQSCHPLIYNEYYESSHRKASTMNDPVYKAVWDRHPGKEKNEHTCAKCHSPSDKGVVATQVLVQNSIQQVSPISCVYCHSIKDVEEHNRSNTNIMNTKDKKFYSAESDRKAQDNVQFKSETSFFGLNQTRTGSAYHEIDYTNENYYTGNVCMGCHSHRLNEHGVDVYLLDAKIDETDEETCISCHMPQVPGSKVNLYDSGTHAYHGIAGIRQMSGSLGKYIDFKVEKKASGFNVQVTNKANHALFGHPLRAGILRVEILRGSKTIKLETFVFSRLLSKDGEIAMSWEADDTLSDTLLYAKKSLDYEAPLEPGDKVALTMGLYIVNPLLLESLDLQDVKEIQGLQVLKKELFEF